MTNIKFSADTPATNATSITVSLGGSPSVGDLVLVWLGTSNEIVTHQPGYSTEFTTTPNPWFKMDGLRSPDTTTLTGWYHTWNASDSGSSVVFTFVPAPTLGVGDKDLPNTNAVAHAIVLDGSLNTAVLDHNVYGVWTDLSSSITASPQKRAASMSFFGVLSNQSSGLVLSVTSQANTVKGYAPTFNIAQVASPIVQAVSVSDSGVLTYNPPFIEEGPVALNPLMGRYRLFRYFTVLNNSGTFTARRYLSTDDIAAATQVFKNNQSITLTDRTNILTAGVGGDFQAVS